MDQATCTIFYLASIFASIYKTSNGSNINLGIHKIVIQSLLLTLHVVILIWILSAMKIMKKPSQPVEVELTYADYLSTLNKQGTSKKIESTELAPSSLNANISQKNTLRRPVPQAPVVDFRQTCGSFDEFPEEIYNNVEETIYANY